jgi:hypothetical protein
MSHFTVLVIGDNVAAQLQPFHEFECTGTDDQFVIDKDVTAECAEHADDDYPLGLGWFGLEERIVTDESQIDKADKHKYGFALVRDGKLVKAVNRTNPNRKWDWWRVGGRWSGMLKLKTGATGETGSPGLMGSHFAEGADRADQALKRDIDFTGMRDEAAQKAGALWDKARAITCGKTWESWPSVRARMEIEAARQFYNEQPAITALKAADKDEFGRYIDDTLAGSREAFVNAARNRAGATFAVLYKGEWTERGRMGWWACVSDEMDENKWYELYASLLDGLPDDTLLTVVDCHI